MPSFPLIHQCPEPASTPRLISSGRKRQPLGTNVATSKNGTRVARASRSADCECVLEQVSWSAFFGNPYAAFPAAISSQFAVPWTRSDGARQIHWSAAGRAQLLPKQAIPTHARNNDFSGTDRRDDGHNCWVFGRKRIGGAIDQTGRPNDRNGTVRR